MRAVQLSNEDASSDSSGKTRPATSLCTLGINKVPDSMQQVHTWVVGLGVSLDLLVDFRLLVFLHYAGQLESKKLFLFSRCSSWGLSTNLVFSMCHWLDFWSVLQKSDHKKKMIAGSSLLRKVMIDILITKLMAGVYRSAWRQHEECRAHF